MGDDFKRVGYDNFHVISVIFFFIRFMTAATFLINPINFEPKNIAKGI